MAGLLDFAQMVQQLYGNGLLQHVADPIAQRKMGLLPNLGTEGARPRAGGGRINKLRARDLMPAIQYQDGSILSAPRPGMQHFELYEMGANAGRGTARDTGYLDMATGKFISQSEMYNWK